MCRITLERRTAELEEKLRAALEEIDSAREVGAIFSSQITVVCSWLNGVACQEAKVLWESEHALRAEHLQMKQKVLSSWPI